MQITPTPDEVETLILLDGALTHPEGVSASASADEPKPARATPAWPTKKVAVDG